MEIKRKRFVTRFFSGQVRLEVQGFSRGLVILEEGRGGCHYLWLSFTNSVIRRDLWRELENIKDSYSGPWF